MEEEDATPDPPDTEQRRYDWQISRSLCIRTIPPSPPWFSIPVGCAANQLTSPVITDPEDSRFDLEAYLKMKAGEN